METDAEHKRTLTLDAVYLYLKFLFYLMRRLKLAARAL